LTDEDAVPELPEVPVSRTSDLWLLGDHRVLIGDATSENDVRRLMGCRRRRPDLHRPAVQRFIRRLHGRPLDDPRRSDVRLGV
jgi:hypothetical protein